MKIKPDFSKLAKHLSRSSHRVRSPQLLHPTREWFIGLAVAAVIFTGSAFWSAQMYLVHRDESVVAEPLKEVEVVVYREAVVAEALARFAAKEARYAELVQQQVFLPEENDTAAAASTTENSASSTESVIIIEQLPATAPTSTVVTTSSVVAD